MRKSAIAVCRRGFDDVNHAAPFALRMIPAESKVRHQFGKLLQLLQIVRLIFFRKFDDQQRIRIAAHGRLDHGPEHRDVAAERNHGAVDQFHRDRPQLHQMLRRIHRLVETAEMADAEHLVADDRPQLEFDLRGEGQRAFGADQQMRHDCSAHCAAPAHRDCSRRRGAAPLETARDISAASRSPRSSMSRNSASPLCGEFTCARSRGTSPKCKRVPSASAASIDSVLSRMVP